MHLDIFGHDAERKRGAVLFAKNGCAHCHGENGIGGGRGPDLRDVGDHLRKDQIRFQIEHGGMMMPAYGQILDDKQVSDVVEYLRTHRDRSHMSTQAGHPK